VAYHERTKHHYQRYAASLGYLDWAKQPDPFRRYDGAPLVRLPLPVEGRALPYWQLYIADSVVPAPLSVDSISLFLRYAFSLTAWKQFEGTTWSLRANPFALKTEKFHIPLSTLEPENQATQHRDSQARQRVRRRGRSRSRNPIHPLPGESDTLRSAHPAFFAEINP
jgi:hypothetical protein